MTTPADPRHRALRHFGSNALSIVSSEAVIRVSNFVVYATIARNAGALDFGRLSLALSLFFVFQILAGLGQRTVAIRDVARDPDLAVGQLRASFAVVSLGAIAALGPLALLMLVFGWDRTTIVVIAVVFAGLLPYALSQVLEALLIGLERMGLIAIASVPLHVAKAGVAAVLIIQGADVVVAAAVTAGTYWAVFAVELVLCRRFLGRGETWPTRSAVRGAARRGLSFLGVELVFAVNSLVPVLVVSALLGEESVGVLGAAQQAVVPLALVINSLTRVAFPAMCRTFDRVADATRLIVVNLVELILTLVLPLVVTIGVFAATVAELLYDNEEFSPAADLLQLIVWWSVVNVLTTVMGQTLWATNRERASLVIALWATAIGLVGNLIFVSVFGVNGVAVALLCVGLVTTVQHYLPLAGSLSIADLVLSLWRPTVAALCQVVVLVIFSEAATPVRIVGGLVTYVAVAAVLGRYPAHGSEVDRRGRIPLLTFLKRLNDPAEAWVVGR